MSKKCVSICDGVLIPLRMVNDPIFSQRLTGDGVGIKPSSSKFYAPCDGVVKLVMKAGHSMVIEQKGGTHIMVHIGLDTINLNGAGITCHVVKNQKVKKGDLIVELDMEFMKERRVNLTSVVLVMEPREVEKLKLVEQGNAIAGETVIIEYK